MPRGNLILSRAVLLLSLLGFACLPLFAQEAPTPPPETPPAAAPVPAEPTAADAGARLLLAISSAEYPVTPGDTYRITYLQAGTSVASEVTVQSDYTLNMGIFGVFNTRGMTFAELRPTVEKKVAASYPRSTPALTIVSVGVFQVLVRGEVLRVANVSAWGLSRLSDLLSGLLDPYSSIREVRVISPGGQAQVYDLFQAERFGRMDQNPYVRPGDVIEVARRGREVQLVGEVLRPGTYQLLKEDSLEELIERYGGGLTRLAEPSRIRIERVEAQAARTYYIDLKAEYRRVDLVDGDVVTVRSQVTGMPLVFLEGAVLPRPSDASLLGVAAAAPAGEGESASGEATVYNRINQPIKPGETLFGLLEENWPFISAYADLPRAYLLREGKPEPIPVDLERMRRGDTRLADLELVPNDRLVIPSRLFVAPSTVSVFGAVLSPGQYPYVPGRDFMYYLQLAGGINPAQNIGDRVRILDAEGRLQRKNYELRPGDRIYVPNNRFIDNFNRYFPIISSSLAVTTAVITILNLVGPQR